MKKTKSDLETLRKENETLRVKVNALNEAPDRKMQRDLEVFARAEKRMLLNVPGFAPAWETAKSKRTHGTPRGGERPEPLEAHFRPALRRRGNGSRAARPRGRREARGNRCARWRGGFGWAVGRFFRCLISGDERLAPHPLFPMKKLGLLFYAALAIGQNAVADPARSFEIRVIDEQTNRGVPLVELETVNHLRSVTDSAGLAWPSRNPG